jgi:hypothetical protein
MIFGQTNKQEDYIYKAIARVVRADVVFVDVGQLERLTYGRTHAEHFKAHGDFTDANELPHVIVNVEQTALGKALEQSGLHDQRYVGFFLGKVKEDLVFTILSLTNKKYNIVLSDYSASLLFFFDKIKLTRFRRT